MTLTGGHYEANGHKPADVPQAALEPEAAPAAQPKRPPKAEKFEHPLMMQQSPFWSRTILWSLMAAVTAALTWACTAQIEEAIPAQGKLEPQGTVKRIQSPVNGVVKEVFVKEGQQVEPGDLLLQIDPTTAQAQLASLQQIRLALTQENQFYQAQMQGNAIAAVAVEIPSQFLTLTQNRAELVAENQLFRTQLKGSTAGMALSPLQAERLQFSQAESETRATAARLEADQAERQLAQTQAKLASARNTLALNQSILREVDPLAQAGAISRIQYLKQQQEVEMNQSEVNQLIEEAARLRLSITEANTKVENVWATDRKDLSTRMAQNDQSVAEIDSQLSKAIVENNKRMAEIDSQISQAQQTLTYGDLRATTAGTVFELKATSPGFVVNTTEPVLEIVPNEALVAKISITNQDIGFVEAGMAVDVRIDSFPFSEFGDIEGKLVWIGSDALPPTQIQPLYTFPAKIEIDQQSLRVKGREIQLQSGMSVSVNIKVRERRAITIFTSQFTKMGDRLQQVR
ncbi:HlyD family efflux transporter periplasmic adaptor subunit [Romeria aff. gracilis LEGE 07310]|uniref:HlyD family efflux transporter periplasmic adaptor subunit n=1 Tax=Vasconcelosia minhoensis LEGE 07310 TaxID=915328 RepID=A0A8J7DD19_9CYAN|nr:HlyD family efflux transporter periplasmic adaptor subunit [Romeria gracilis]MBE9078263.1 HlyD family efflux transporter periplasmic adaptor subunit [Romeria aff. gracilis LEGE 07310]